jgi:hypothetical protein
VPDYYAAAGQTVLIPGAVETDQFAARKRFFLKKEAKTFAYWCARCGSLDAMRTKVFWFFFSKKNCLLFLLARLGYGLTMKAAGIRPIKPRLP